MTSRWFNPTGGFGYHVRALFRRGGVWAPFIRDVALWLDAWSPPEDELLLIGPSGGHCLEPGFLRRFRSIVAVDIDPFAPLVFRWRMRSVLREGAIQIEWDSHDYLSPGPAGFDIDPCRQLIEAHPGRAVLFCNILGQLPLLGDDRDPEQSDGSPIAGSFERWLLDLPATLRGRSWATFHDRISGNLAPHSLDPHNPVLGSSSEELLQHHYDLRHERELTLRDHRTSVLLRELPRRQFVWELVPGLFHLIEAFSFRSQDNTV